MAQHQLLHAALFASLLAATVATCPPGSDPETCAASSAADDAAEAEVEAEEDMVALQLRKQSPNEVQVVVDPVAALGGPWARRRRSPGPIYALTDMGFDDLGAFSILHASGHDPEAILTVSGMMEPSESTANFATLLQSWGIDSPVYKGPDGCHHDCLNSSFIGLPYTTDSDPFSGWGYRDNIATFYPLALNTTAPPPQMKDGSQFPWTQCDEKYRLLILSPMSQFDYRVWEDPDVLKCISEVVVSGCFFGDSEEGRAMATNNNNTWIQLIPLSVGNLASINPQPLDAQFAGPPEGGADSSTLRELNVISDALAAARSLATAASKGVKITIVPLEVESIERYGMQTIQNDASLVYTGELQANITNTFIANNLCRNGAVRPGNEDGGLLQRMACINTPPAEFQQTTLTQYTLDMDAIVATYFWEPKLFTFEEESLVAIDSLSGMTYSDCERVKNHDGSCRCEGTADVLTCFEVKRATKFDAIGWFEKLNKILEWPAGARTKQTSS